MSSVAALPALDFTVKSTYTEWSNGVIVAGDLSKNVGGDTSDVVVEAWRLTTSGWQRNWRRTFDSGATDTVAAGASIWKTGPLTLDIWGTTWGAMPQEEGVTPVNFGSSDAFRIVLEVTSGNLLQMDQFGTDDADVIDFADMGENCLPAFLGVMDGVPRFWHSFTAPGAPDEPQWFFSDLDTETQWWKPFWYVDLGGTAVDMTSVFIDGYALVLMADGSVARMEMGGPSGHGYSFAQHAANPAVTRTAIAATVGVFDPSIMGMREDHLIANASGGVEKIGVADRFTELDTVTYALPGAPVLRDIQVEGQWSPSSFVVAGERNGHGYVAKLLVADGTVLSEVEDTNTTSIGLLQSGGASWIGESVSGGEAGTVLW